MYDSGDVKSLFGRSEVTYKRLSSITFLNDWSYTYFLFTIFILLFYVIHFYYCSRWSSSKEELFIVSKTSRFKTCLKKMIFVKNNFFICYLADKWPTLGHYRGYNLTLLMSITAFSSNFELKVTRNLVTRQVGFELGTFRFYHNALTCYYMKSHETKMMKLVILSNWIVTSAIYILERQGMCAVCITKGACFRAI